MRHLAYLMLTAVCFTACTSKPSIVNEYSVYNLGVERNSVAVQTTAIQSAINKVNEKGGGTLLIPFGEIISGTLELKPNVSIHINGNAVLKGSADLNDYRTLYKDKLTFIYGDQLNGISITGQGTIDGQGHLFWDEDFKA